MFPAIQFGRLFGIPLRARVSFLAMLALVLLFWGGLAGIVVTLLAFGSIILHELGHALTARSLGVGVRSIDLHFFGGVASLSSNPKSANDEALIAAAGPAVSLALAVLSYLVFAASGLEVFGLLAGVNAVIGVFNLLPALPMDGGRIFRALLSKRRGFRGATEIAVKASRVVAIGFAVIGLAYLQIQLLLLAFVLWSMASSELQMARHNIGYRDDAARPYEEHRVPLHGELLQYSPFDTPAYRHERYRSPAVTGHRVVILRYSGRSRG